MEDPARRDVDTTFLPPEELKGSVAVQAVEGDPRSVDLSPMTAGGVARDVAAEAMGVLKAAPGALAVVAMALMREPFGVLGAARDALREVMEERRRLAKFAEDNPRYVYVPVVIPPQGFLWDSNS